MTIELEILVLAGAAIGLVCGIIGYWWASSSQRRAAGGKSVEELATEKQQYEAEVVEHFKASADLLNEMTDKYRDVYRHMAEGAQKLVPGDNVAPALAALQSGLLAAPGEPPRDVVLESEANTENTASDTSDDSDLVGEGALEEDGMNVAVNSDEVASADTGAVSEPASEEPAPEDELQDTISDNNEEKGFFSSEPDVSLSEVDGTSSTEDGGSERST